jgi:hypothetical protein
MWEYERMRHDPVLSTEQVGLKDCLNNQGKTYIIWKVCAKVIPLAG